MLNYDRELIERANSVSMFDAGDAIVKDYERAYTIGLEKLNAVTVYTEEQEKYINTARVQWAQLVESHAADALRRRASWVSWAVAGPANYNARGNSKKADAAMHAEQENSDRRAAFLSNVAKAAEAMRPANITAELIRSGRINPEISSTDPHAAELIQAKIDYLTEQREAMKQQNAYYKKRGTLQGFPGISDAEAAEMDEAIKNSFPPVPFAPYTLQNSLATVSRLRDRLQEIERIKAAPAPAVNDAAAPFQIVEDAATMRINIITADKPAADVIAAFKAAGFHWSPRAKQWTRQLTDNARRSVSRLLQQFSDAAQEAPQEAQEPAQEATQEPAALTVSQFVQLLRERKII